MAEAQCGSKRHPLLPQPSSFCSLPFASTWKKTKALHLISGYLGHIPELVCLGFPPRIESFVSAQTWICWRTRTLLVSGPPIGNYFRYFTPFYFHFTGLCQSKIEDEFQKIWAQIYIFRVVLQGLWGITLHLMRITIIKTRIKIL